MRRPATGLHLQTHSLTAKSRLLPAYPTRDKRPPDLSVTDGIFKFSPPSSTPNYALPMALTN